MPDRRALVTLFALLVLLVLNGCGLKGPLYIPPPEAEAEAAAEPDGEPGPADVQTPAGESEDEAGSDG